MRHLLAFPGLVGALALALAGCGTEATNQVAPTRNTAAETGGAATAAAAPGPCSFITKEEVTAIIGEAIVEAKAEGFTCRYDSDDAMASFVQVDFKPSGGAGEMAAAQSAASTLRSIGNEMKNAGGAAGDTGALPSESAAAPSIGDQAFFGTNQQLSVLKGDVYFAVSPPHMRSRMRSGNPLLPAVKQREMAAAIAQTIAAKL